VRALRVGEGQLAVSVLPFVSDDSLKDVVGPHRTCLPRHSRPSFLELKDIVNLKDIVDPRSLN